MSQFKRRLPPTVQRDALLGDAYLGWREAKRHFDPHRGVPFNGFAYRRVVGAMQDGLRARREPRTLGRGYTHEAIAPARPQGNDLPWRRLPKVGRLVVQLHYFEALELKTVAGIFACSQARVSQMHQAALRQLRALAA